VKVNELWLIKMSNKRKIPIKDKSLWSTINCELLNNVVQMTELTARLTALRLVCRLNYKLLKCLKITEISQSLQLHPSRSGGWSSSTRPHRTDGGAFYSSLCWWIFRFSSSADFNLQQIDL